MLNLSHFEEHDQKNMIELIRANPLGTVIICTEHGFEVNHIPFVFDATDSVTKRLNAHIPRSNPLKSILSESRECVLIFQAANGYITPSWYATKEEHGKVVPTWNYSVVHIHGDIELIDDPNWILIQLEELTELNEQARKESWKIADAPKDFITSQLKALIGLQVVVSKFEAKTKASQNQPPKNRNSIRDALEREMPDTELQKMMLKALDNVDKKSPDR